MLLDTSVWVEYFLGTEKGLKVASMLKSGAPVFVCPITYSEISSWAQKNGQPSEPFIRKIGELSITLELDKKMMVLGGRAYAELRKTRKVSLIDSIIYASAALHGLTLFTCDFDFAGLPGSELL